LFPILRVLADRPDTPARFLVLGSAGPELLRQTSESLAGRVAFHTLDGFDMEELGTGALERLWLRGGFPRAALATNDAAAMRWLGSFCATFLERDLPQLGVRVPAPTMQRFWQMLAHWHGNVWSGAEFARAIGVGEHAVRRYLDLLASALVVRVLPPWHANSAKRQVRSPKVYVRDSGVLHSLLDLPRMDALLRHPKVGASWEGFLLTQVIALLQVPPERCWFWATHAGAELDLLVQHRGRRLGFEFKRTTTPRVTPSMRAALTDLGLERLDVVHAGTTTWDMAERVRAVAAQDLVAVLGAEGRA
jgi:predicted AAA+ superfamily ATPase